MIHQLNLLFKKYLKSNPSNKYTELEGTREKIYTGILIKLKLVALYAAKHNYFDFNSIHLKHMKELWMVLTNHHDFDLPYQR